MAQIVLRKLDDRVVARLKDRARRNGRSLQAELETILCDVAGPSRVDHEAAISGIVRLRERLRGRKFPDSVSLIREDRDR